MKPMDFHTLRQALLQDLARSLQAIEPGQFDALAARLLSSPRLFIAGRGRTGLQMRAFAMRLMHLGFTVYVVDDVTTPAIEAGDVLVAGSASGQTASIVHYVQQARARGAGVVLLTTAPGSSAAQAADLCVYLPATRHKQAAPDPAAFQPRGALFEQTLLLLLDLLILRLMAARGMDESALFRRHANLE